MLQHPKTALRANTLPEALLMAAIFRRNERRTSSRPWMPSPGILRLWLSQWFACAFELMPLATSEKKTCSFQIPKCCRCLFGSVQERKWPSIILLPPFRDSAHVTLLPLTFPLHKIQNLRNMFEQSQHITISIVITLWFWLPFNFKPCFLVLVARTTRVTVWNLCCAVLM